MTPRQLLAYCMTKTGSYVEFPFGDEPACVKVKGRIFAQVYPRGEDSMATLKCGAAFGHALRQAYPGAIDRGYHCPPVQQPYWNTVRFCEDISDPLWLEMIDHAYEAVVAKLPKSVRGELDAEG